MLVLNMNSKRQRKPNVRLWELGDLPAAFACSVSRRISTDFRQRMWEDDSCRNDGTRRDNNLGVPQQFSHEFGMASAMSADLLDDNKNHNSIDLVPDVSSHDDKGAIARLASKPEFSFGCVTRKSRVMKRRRRSPESLFQDPWGSATKVGKFTPKCSGNLDKCDNVETEECTISSVGEWLEETGFGKYRELFEMHEVDVETLPLLTPNDLKEMGIFAVGIRRKLLNAIWMIR